MSIKIHDKFFRPYIRHEEIIAAVERIAERLNADFKGRNDVPVLLCTLNGAIPFTAELMKHLDFNHTLTTVKASSYAGTCSTGKVQITMGGGTSFEGKTVLVCEDLIDTGQTLNAMKKYLIEEKGAAQVLMCSLIVKTGHYRMQLVKDGTIPEDADEETVKKHLPEYFGINCADEFLLGFGMDYNELGRQYKDIYILDE